ncbi:uncharacterized protein MYCFIDRAFT_206774 [Pseudocercospora fijiensis CIRAD86]|uniref:Uncharacterized protein n=1 Tax=Pseudocercospora fijiensis (strain CIRAD86) TaxID=383855 RepID=M3ANY9_PSEFD|nr:uncharacterized protein MYCFIDRAFT_206774 [Pseudocercospora fijiensis CIRAD86]EME86296.1 hypothetical protein MYCFIDRAFT_206774 [Pseudocercospora fijiensis CIRAD86]
MVGVAGCVRSGQGGRSVEVKREPGIFGMPVSCPGLVEPSLAPALQPHAARAGAGAGSPQRVVSPAPDRRAVATSRHQPLSRCNGHHSPVTTHHTVTGLPKRDADAARKRLARALHPKALHTPHIINLLLVISSLLDEETRLLIMPPHIRLPTEIRSIVAAPDQPLNKKSEEYEYRREVVTMPRATMHQFLQSYPCPKLLFLRFNAVQLVLLTL